MKAPGEGLLIKLWDTLVDRGIGSLLKPWQIGREARAHREARKIDIVELAQAQRLADEISAGRVHLVETSRQKIRLSWTATKSADQIDPTFDIAKFDELNALSIETATSESIRREVNVAKAILHAESELINDPSNPTQDRVEEDWMHRWKNGASEISSDEMQLLWGRILAGEIKAPGSYSYRTMELISNLTVKEAQQIEELFSFVLRDTLVRDGGALERAGFSLDKLLDFQEIGIIHGAESGFTVTLGSMRQENFINVLVSDTRVLILKADDPKRKLTLGGLLLSQVGKQLFALGKFKPNEEFLRSVGAHVKTQGFSVGIADVHSNLSTADEIKITWVNEEQL